MFSAGRIGYRLWTLALDKIAADHSDSELIPCEAVEQKENEGAVWETSIALLTAVILSDPQTVSSPKGKATVSSSVSAAVDSYSNEADGSK